MSDSSRRKFLATGAAVATGAAAIGAPAIVRAQEVTRWRCQSMWSAAELSYKAFQDFCERVKVNTNAPTSVNPSDQK